jgi:hypothetical protein
VPEEIEGEPMNSEKNDYRRNHGPGAHKDTVKYVHGAGPLNRCAWRIRNMERLQARTRRADSHRAALRDVQTGFTEDGSHLGEVDVTVP